MGYNYIGEHKKPPTFDTKQWQKCHLCGLNNAPHAPCEECKNKLYQTIHAYIVSVRNHKPLIRTQKPHFITPNTVFCYKLVVQLAAQIQGDCHTTGPHKGKRFLKSKTIISNYGLETTAKTIHDYCVLEREKGLNAEKRLTIEEDAKKRKSTHYIQVRNQLNTSWNRQITLIEEEYCAEEIWEKIISLLQETVCAKQ